MKHDPVCTCLQWCYVLFHLTQCVTEYVCVYMFLVIYMVMACVCVFGGWGGATTNMAASVCSVLVQSQSRHSHRHTPFSLHPIPGSAILFHLAPYAAYLFLSHPINPLLWCVYWCVLFHRKGTQCESKSEIRSQIAETRLRFHFITIQRSRMWTCWSFKPTELYSKSIQVYRTKSTRKNWLSVGEC